MQTERERVAEELHAAQRRPNAAAEQLAKSGGEESENESRPRLRERKNFVVLEDDDEDDEKRARELVQEFMQGRSDVASVSLKQVRE